MTVARDELQDEFDRHVLWSLQRICRILGRDERFYEFFEKWVRKGWGRKECEADLPLPTIPPIAPLTNAFWKIVDYSLRFCRAGEGYSYTQAVVQLEKFFKQVDNLHHEIFEAKSDAARRSVEKRQQWRNSEGERRKQQVDEAFQKWLEAQAANPETKIRLKTLFPKNVGDDGWGEKDLSRKIRQYKRDNPTTFERLREWNERRAQREKSDYEKLIRLAGLVWQDY